MRKLTLWTVAFFVATLAVPTAHAGTITVTDGSAVIGPGATGFGTISLAGDHGFSLDGFLSSEGRLDAKLCLPCVAGDSISPDAFFSGFDLSVKSMTFDGLVYTDVNRANSTTSVFVTFDGPPVTAPPVTSNMISFAIPFSLGGRLSIFPAPANPSTTLPADLTGSGVAMLSLRRNLPTDNLWLYDGIQYTIGESSPGPGPAPVPEPSTLLLTASGVALVARRLIGHR